MSRRWPCRTALLALGLAVSSSRLAFAQRDTVTALLTTINAHAAAIQRLLPSLRTDSVDLLGLSAEGGAAVVYRDPDGTLRLIRTSLYGESGRVFDDLYVADGNVILDVELDERYNVPFYVDDSLARDLGTDRFDPGKTTYVTGRYYFDRGHLIRWEAGGAVNDPNTAAFVSKEQDLLRYYSEVLKQLGAP